MVRPLVVGIFPQDLPTSVVAMSALRAAALAADSGSLLSPSFGTADMPFSPYGFLSPSPVAAGGSSPRKLVAAAVGSGTAVPHPTATGSPERPDAASKALTVTHSESGLVLRSRDHGGAFRADMTPMQPGHPSLGITNEDEEGEADASSDSDSDSDAGGGWDLHAAAAKARKAP